MLNTTCFHTTITLRALFEHFKEISVHARFSICLLTAIEQTKRMSNANVYKYSSQGRARGGVVRPAAGKRKRKRRHLLVPTEQQRGQYRRDFIQVPL